MNKPTHTPGPWEIERGYSTIIKSIGPCVPDEYAGSAWLEVSEADARLIAAAPDLLEALKAMLSEVEGCYCTTEKQARAAIEKATSHNKV